MPDNEAPQSPLPLNPDLAGYPTTEALVAGYRNSSAEGQRLKAENEQVKGLLNQVLAANPRQVPDRRSSSPEDRLTEFGVPVDALSQLVDSRVQQALAPISRGIQARGKVVSDHPGYVQFEADVAAFIASDPDLSQSYPMMFEANPEGAMEYAFLKFGDSRRRTVQTQDARNGVEDAQIPGSRVGEGRRAPSQDGVQEAYERFQKTGSTRDAAAYAKARLHSVIKDEFLNQ